VLHGISFTAQPGQMVALVGSSGAGKSTIASLLGRLYDIDLGAVRLNGVDVRDVSFASLKETVAWSLRTGTYHESIGSNLRLANPDATDDEAVDRAGPRPARHVVAEMPTALTPWWGSGATGSLVGSGSG